MLNSGITYIAKSNLSELDPDSEQIILQQVPNCIYIHHGGTIHFGNDGHLYVSIGDEGFAEQAQNVDNMLGAIIRININGNFPYEIPQDNPILENGQKNEIFTFGFRNPWKWSFDRLTNEIFVGDVGKDRWEEVNLIKKNSNYGWPAFEGPACVSEPCLPDNFTFPLVSYDHDEGCAIIGGTSIVEKKLLIFKGFTYTLIYVVEIFEELRKTQTMLFFQNF